MKNFFKALVFGGSMLLSYGLHAATYNPTSALELQSNLTEAAANGEDDTITLAASTTYSATSIGARFEFSSAEANSLTLVGAGATSTLIDGGSAFQGMYLTSSAGAVSVSGIGFQNGAAAMGVSGGGLIVGGTSLNVQDCVFSNNSVNNGGTGGGVHLTTSGDIIFSNNTVDANDTLVSGDSAGAVLSSTTGSVTAENNVFTANVSAGNIGGVGISGATVVFNNNSVSSNSATSNGGGSIVASTGNIEMDGNTISSNQASASIGGIALSAGADLSFTNNTVNDNEGGTTGGASIGAVDTITITDNSFRHNVANAVSGDNGGVYVSGAALVFSNNILTENTAVHDFAGASLSSTVGATTFSGNTVSLNAAGSSYGGINLSAANGLIVTENTFISNTAVSLYGAGGLSVIVGNAQIANNLVVNNTATAGGGLNISDTSTGTPTNLNIVNNTVYSNSVTGSAIAGLAVTATDSSVTVNVYNNILYANTNDGTLGLGQDAYINNSSGNLNIFNNDVGELCFAAPASCDIASLGADAGDNLVSENPLFIDASTGNYRLQATSTLIDRGLLTAPGLPSTDIVGNPRSFLTIPDIGAYEAVAEVLSSSTTLDFGSVSTNDANSIVITLSNNGTYDLNVSALTLSDTTNFAVQTDAGSNPCGASSFSIASGESCTLGVEFAPDAEQTFNETLTIVSDAPANPSYAIALTGVGTAAGASGGCSLQSSGSNTLVWILTLLPLIGMMRLRRLSH